MSDAGAATLYHEIVDLWIGTSVYNIAGSTQAKLYPKQGPGPRQTRFYTARVSAKLQIQAQLGVSWLGRLQGTCGFLYVPKHHPTQEVRLG